MGLNRVSRRYGVKGGGLVELDDAAVERILTIVQLLAVRPP